MSDKDMEKSMVTSVIGELEMYEFFMQTTPSLLKLKLFD